MSKKKALNPRVDKTLPLTEKKDVLTRINIPNQEAKNVGTVTSYEMLC